MRPLIESPEEIARLVEVARAWEGTRWCSDGAFKGHGVSCNMLPYAILAELGHVAPPPPARAGMLKKDILPTMEMWFPMYPECYAACAKDEIRPGDVLLYNAGIGHLALALDQVNIIDSYAAIGAQIRTRTNIKLADRLLSVWRPILHG